jgi:two-component system, LytTR family, sensor kinase
MQSLTEKKLILYASLFIAVILNMTKLLALREGAFIGQYWHFNGWELLFQALLNFGFCLLFTNIILNLPKFINAGSGTKTVLVVIAGIALILLTDIIGIGIQKKIFLNTTPDKIFRGGYTLRLVVSAGLIIILTRIIYLLRESKAKDKENERLQNAYLNAQLQLLKEELNPHFFFNALSSLSAIVREDQKLAQQYISHLSKIFRYTLNAEKKEKVTLKEELTVFDSYAALMKMRLEDGLIININIPDDYLNKQLPYMSLQPLLENAVKHNVASAANPLRFTISSDDNYMLIQNNLQPVSFAEDTTGTGLVNLGERFRILMQKEIEIIKTGEHFTIKLPL